MKNYDITAVPKLKGVVYMLTNPLGERYIGSAKDLRERMGHYRRGGHGLIGDSILKYGFENHTLSILAKNILDKNLLTHEYKWIKKIDPELNLVTVNAGGIVQHAESTKKKIADANSNPSAEIRAKISAAQKGVSKSAEHRAKLAEIKKGKKLPLQHCALLSTRIQESYHRKNHERDKKIISMRKKGKTCQEIADCFSLSENSVIYICKRSQVEISKALATQLRNSKRDKKIISMKKKGKTFQEIADCMGLSVGGVYSIYRRNAKISEKVLTTQLHKLKRDKKIISMRKKGKTCQEIADCLGLSYDQVHRVQHNAETLKVKEAQLDRKQKRDKKIISMRKKGKIQQEIADCLGLKRSYVSRICRQHQIEIPEKVLAAQQLHKHKRNKKIISMRKKGKTYQEIADCMGLSVGGVNYICQQHHAEISKMFATQLDRKQKRDKKIINMRKKGKTYQEIADCLGLTKDCVGSICRQANKQTP